MQEQLENLTQLKQSMEMEKMKLLLDLQVIKYAYFIKKSTWTQTNLNIPSIVEE